MKNKTYTTMFQSLSLQTWGTGVIGTFSYRTVAVRYWKYCPWHMVVRIRSFHNKLFILHLWSWHLILISILCSFNLPARILTVIYKKLFFYVKKLFLYVKKLLFYIKKQLFYCKKTAFLRVPFFYATYIYIYLTEFAKTYLENLTRHW